MKQETDNGDVGGTRPPGALAEIRALLDLAIESDRKGLKAKAAAIRSGIADQLMENVI